MDDVLKLIFGENSPFSPELTANYGNYRMSMIHVTITPEAAQSILDSCHYDRQRNLKKSNVIFLRKQMEAGKFLPTTTLTMDVRKTSVGLVDGRHRLTAVVESETTQGFWLQFLCAPIARAEVYTTIDTGVARTNYDGMIALGTFDDYSFGSSRMSSIVAAVRRIYAGMLSSDREKLTATETSDLVREWVKVSEVFHDHTSGGTLSNRLRSSKIMAVGLLTTRFQPERSEEFWRGVSADDGLAKDDPRKHLIRQLVDRSSPLRSISGSHDKWSALYMAKCWNLFWANEAKSRIIIDTSSDIILDGTPYDSAKQHCGLT